MPKETQSSLANDVRDVEQAGTMQDFIVRYEVVPSDMQDASLAPYMEWIQFIAVGLYINLLLTYTFLLIYLLDLYVYNITQNDNVFEHTMQKL